MAKAARLLIRKPRSLPLCSTCLHNLRSASPIWSVNLASRRYNSKAASSSQAAPLTGYYAEILANPVSEAHPSRPTRLTPPPTAHGNPHPSAAASSAVSSSPTTDGPPTPPPPPPPPQTTTAKFDPADPASTARIVFGSRLAGPARAASRAALARSVGGVLVPPRPLEPDNCCMSGCVNCVWDVYREEVEEWAVAAAKARAALAAAAAAAPAAQKAGGAASKVEDTGMGKKKKKGRRKKEEAKAAAEGDGLAGSVDDDGGGNDVNWAGQFEDAAKSQEELMKGIPIGIREFMRTEKMLKQRHMDESKTI